MPALRSAPDTAPDDRRPAHAPDGGGVQDFVVTERPQPGEDTIAPFRRLAAALQQRDATLVSLMIYGAVVGADRAEIATAIAATLGAVAWPVTWVEGASCDGAPLAGVQAFAVVGTPVRRITLDGRIVGSVYEDGTARHCLLGGLVPPAVALPRVAQAEQLFHHFAAALAQAGFTLADVARTWFYNDDILGWYDEFNRVRTACYRPVAFRTGSLPASTGIGARNPAGAALTVAAWAVQPLRPAARVVEVGSPLQGPAPAYGSAFSRAVEITSGRSRRLLISGTASIHPDGQTAWPGDIARQIALTMEVVAAILQSRGMALTDITRATAYFRDAAGLRPFATWCAAHALPALPCVPMQSVICRDDLLWEIEVDASVDDAEHSN